MNTFDVDLNCLYDIRWYTHSSAGTHQINSTYVKKTFFSRRWRTLLYCCFIFLKQRWQQYRLWY